jgi:hypothetical protein
MYSGKRTSPFLYLLNDIHLLTTSSQESLFENSNPVRKGDMPGCLGPIGKNGDKEQMKDFSCVYLYADLPQKKPLNKKPSKVFR